MFLLLYRSLLVLSNTCLTCPSLVLFCLLVVLSLWFSLLLSNSCLLYWSYFWSYLLFTPSCCYLLVISSSSYVLFSLVNLGLCTSSLWFIVLWSHHPCSVGLLLLVLVILPSTHYFLFLLGLGCLTPLPILSLQISLVITNNRHSYSPSIPG